MKHVLATLLLITTSFTVNASYTGANETIRQCEIHAGVMKLVLKAHNQGRPKSEITDALTAGGETLDPTVINMINGIYRGAFNRFTPNELYDVLYGKCVEVNLK